MRPRWRCCCRASRRGTCTGPRRSSPPASRSSSTPDKRELALQLGADAAVDVGADDLAERLIEANGGERVDAVFEMAGGSVFEASMKAPAPSGRLVTSASPRASRT